MLEIIWIYDIYVIIYIDIQLRSRKDFLLLTKEITSLFDKVNDWIFWWNLVGMISMTSRPAPPNFIKKFSREVGDLKI